MSIIQQPDTLSLSQNLRPFLIGATEPVSFELKKGSVTLLSQRYEPGDNGQVEIDIRDVVHSQLSYRLLQSGEVYEQASLVSDFTAIIDSNEVNFRAIRGGVDRLADSATNFLTQNWLTWQPTVKPVTYYSPEFLTYYAVQACNVKLKAYYSNTENETASVASLESGKAYTLPLQYATVAKLLGNKLPGYYDVWVESPSGLRLTYVQRYVASPARSRDEEWILFENSLGGLDTFRAYGMKALNAKHTHNIAEQDEISSEYRVDTDRFYTKNTGYLSPEESRWLLDFFPSTHKYVYTGSYLRAIVVTESQAKDELHKEPASYSFTYKYADARPLLNLPRTDEPADILEIKIPELGNFTLPPRLAEVPRLPLSEGDLFPIQNPYSESWSTTTTGALATVIGQLLAANAGDGGGVGHSHKNIDLLNMQSFIDGYLLVDGKKINAGYADKAGSIDGLDKELESILNKCIRKDRPDSTDHLTNFNAGITLGTDKKPLHDIIRSVDNAIPSDTSVYSSLSIDTMISGLEDKYIHKDKPDSTLYEVDFTAGLMINSKRIGDVIRYYDATKPAATDANIYSALQTDQRIEEEFGKIDDRYIRKDKVDVAHKHITFEEGITVEQLAKLMNLDVKQLATIARAVCAVVRSSKFVDGFAGEGYQIWQDIASGDWCMTLDRLTVRKVLTIYELVVAKIRSVGGMIVVSAANGIIKSAERIGDQYVLEFDDVNQFVPGDLMRCQVFSPSGLKYYWVRVSAVNGEKVYVPASEFAGVEPVKGDEVVLMGNTDNPLRQNLLLISATEDGQPRFDCLDGVKSKSLEGCLKVRVGALNGISDSRFPADMQPSGYGIYGNNCFLTGIFVLSNGKDVMTMFSIMEGMIKSEISSVRNEINAKDNYLDNAAFADNMSGWSGTSNIRIFRVDGRLLYFNNNFYARKDAFAGIATDGTKNVLRLKNSSITQRNADFARHPEFDLYGLTSTDEEGNEIVSGQQYRTRMFYINFRYKVTRPGTLRVYFKGEDADGFEEYVPINYTEVLNPTEEFKVMEIAGKWNGTGDFFLSFSGDMYLYSLALADNRLADAIEKFTMRFEATDKKIQANLDEIKKTGTKLEEYHSEFLLTARNLQLQFTEDLSDAESRITAAYKSYVNLTARDLTVQFLEDLSDAESRITEAYTSAIELSARGLRADFTADLTDMEEGITSAYKSYVILTAQNLQAGFTEDLADLRTGVTEAYTSAIELSARGLRTEFSSSITDINGKLTQHTSSFHVTAAKIEAMVSATDSISDTIRTAGWITTADGNKLWAAQTDLSKEADNARILAAVGNGKSLYDNPTFAEVSGNALKSRNNISVYNNAGGSAVSITRKSISGVPNDTGFGLEIATSASGGVTPGLGGFFFGTATKANRMMVCKFVAKVPAGYTVEFATNATGDGGVKKWLTAHVGTGNWEEYAYYVRCGSSGSFSSTFFFYLSGGSRPVTWQLASANVYELSAQDLASRYSQIKQTVDSISFEIYGEEGKFSILKQTVDTLSSFIGDGAEGDFSQIIQRIDSIQTKVNKIVLDDEGNVTNVSTAGITTDANGNYLFATKTEYNNQGTQIAAIQSSLNLTAGKVDAIAARFDAEGHLIEGAGWVTTAQGNTLWAAKSTEKSALDAAKAAADAASAAADAMTKANKAYDKAGENATAIVQTNAAISTIAGYFDANGKLIEGAGWLTTANAASIYATKTTVNSLGERVTAAESRITANANSISMTVRKDGIISAINQTAESVTIDAGRINLNGAITANGYFKIGLDGSMEAINATIKGVVQASVFSTPFTTLQTSEFSVPVGATSDIRICYYNADNGSNVDVGNMLSTTSYTHYLYLSSAVEYGSRMVLYNRMTAYTRLATAGVVRMLQCKELLNLTAPNGNAARQFTVKPGKMVELVYVNVSNSTGLVYSRWYVVNPENCENISSATYRDYLTDTIM